MKCQYIIVKKGAIKVDPVESSQKTVSPCYYLEWHQLYINRQDFNLGWIKVRKRYYIFNIT